MQTRRIEAQRLEVLRQTIHFPLHPAEDQCLVVLLRLQKAHDRFVPLAFVNDIIELFDVDVLGCFGADDRDELRLIEQRVGELFDGFGHRGRKEQRLSVLGNVFEDLPHIVEEAHVEHLVRLVQNDDFGIEDIDLSLLIEVLETSGCRHHDLDPPMDQGDLASVAHSSVDRQGSDPGETPQMVELVADLARQLAGRGDNQGPLDLSPGDAIQDRQSEGRRLSGPRMGLPHQISPLQDNGNRLLLNGTGLLEACDTDPFGHLRMQIEFFECHSLPLHKRGKISPDIVQNSHPDIGRINFEPFQSPEGDSEGAKFLVTGH